MKAIVIAAGRGQRLAHLTEQIPKPLVPILGRPMLDTILAALRAGGFGRQDVVLVGGYRAQAIRRAYPDLCHVLNEGWEHNNILLSLMCAREHLREGFVSSYADIVYEPAAVERLMTSPHDVTLVCDTEWRRRYRDRSAHPESDAEKVRLEGARVTEISRHVPATEAAGEFIGVMRLTAAGAACFTAAFDQARARFGEAPSFREGRPFVRAYLIDLLQHMIESGIAIHAVTIDGGYMEIDTTEDAAMAERWWAGRG